MTRPRGFRKRRRVALSGAVAWALFVLAGLAAALLLKKAEEAAK